MRLVIHLACTLHRLLSTANIRLTKFEYKVNILSRLGQKFNQDFVHLRIYEVKMYHTPLINFHLLNEGMVVVILPVLTFSAHLSRNDNTLELQSVSIR